MSDKRYIQFIKSKVQQPVLLAGTLQFTGTGVVVNTATGSQAPTGTIATAGAGWGLSVEDGTSLFLPPDVSSVTRPSLGAVTITFGNPSTYPNGVTDPSTFRRLLWSSATIVLPTGAGASGVWNGIDVQESIVPNVQPSGAQAVPYKNQVTFQVSCPLPSGSVFTGYINTATAYDVPSGALLRFATLWQNGGGKNP